MNGHCLWPPPGVSVGPQLLFKSYTVHKCEVSTVLKMLVFVDDTNMFFSCIDL